MRQSIDLNNISRKQKTSRRTQVPKEELNLTEEEQEDYEPELYPDLEDLPEFDPESIDENEEDVEDPVEGAEFDQFEDENAEEFDELEDEVDDPDQGLDTVNEDNMPEGLNQADIGVEDEGEHDYATELDEMEYELDDAEDELEEEE